MNYLNLRRLRKKESTRKLLSEIRLSIYDFIMPYFVVEGKNQKQQISSMPDIFRYSIDNLIKEVQEIYKLGIQAVLLFGVPDKKDDLGRNAYNKNGVVQKAIKIIKKELPEITVITDVCLCSYTSHGHCGILKHEVYKKSGNFIDDKTTLEVLSKIAISHAQAGADIVAPSAMMDSQVKLIREALDKNGFEDVAIMSYSAKFASNFYGPFRDAAISSPKFADRKSYQLNFCNINEALREIEQDIKEAADIVMIKPALAYLDVIKTVKEKFNIPVAAYNVSGEYSMIKSASQKGWLDEKNVVFEILTSIKRAGADLIITYWAKDVAKWLKQ
ncbi:MAG: porphobilinogen synthase [Endomicrobiia bacterium]